MLERQAEGFAKAKGEGKYRGRKPKAREKAPEIVELFGPSTQWRRSWVRRGSAVALSTARWRQPDCLCRRRRLGSCCIMPI